MYLRFPNASSAAAPAPIIARCSAPAFFWNARSAALSFSGRLAISSDSTTNARGPAIVVSTPSTFFCSVTVNVPGTTIGPTDSLSHDSRRAASSAVGSTAG